MVLALALSDAQRAQIHAQLAALERAGVPLVQALGTLRVPPAQQARVVQAQKLLHQGCNLADAGAQAGLFTPIERCVLHAAILAGSPAQSHERLAQAAATRARLSAGLRTRLLMPVGVFALALFLQPLPALIAGSLSGAAYLSGAILPLLLLAALFALLRQLAQWHTQGQVSPASAVLEPLVLRMPVLGDLLMRAQAQRFFENLALLLASGVPMFDALPTAANTLSLHTLRAQYAGLLQLVQAGASLADALDTLPALGNPAVVGMVATGEGSGRLAELLAHYAKGEGQLLESRQEFLASWIPRLIYGAIVLWIAYGFLSGAGAVLTRRGLE